MSKEKPLVDKEYLLEKFPGKGGWTYAAIPEILQNPKVPFGWVRVKGSVDGFELNRYKLMPMGNGKLFLPVKAAIRKKIKKEAGDKVKVILFKDTVPEEIISDVNECFELEVKEVKENFLKLSDDDQQLYYDWIYDAKNPDDKVQRIIKMMDKLAKGQRFYDLDK